MTVENILYSLATILNEMSPYILLGFFIAGLLHVFISPASMSRHLSGHGVMPVIKAALLGVPLPLCSCGVLPTAVSLKRGGASNGATTSFLIATPQTGVDSIAATYSLLGPAFAVLRPVAALTGALLGGYTVDRASHHDDTECCCPADNTSDASKESFISRMARALRYGFVDMVASVGKWLVIGLIIAALITVFVPDQLFVSLSRYPLLAMLAVVAAAIPMYICATGSIPIALSLMLKGLSPGIAFVMLMAGPAANFASMIILSRNMGRRATIIYLISIVITAISFGLIIDLLLPHSWFIPKVDAVAGSCHAHFNIFESICSAILLLLLAYAALQNRKHNHNHQTATMNTRTYNVKGMSCAHCRATVEKAIAAVAGVESVTVNLADGTAAVTGDAAPDMIVKAVTAAGFDIE